MLHCFSAALPRQAHAGNDARGQGNHGSTSLDPSNINGEPVDVTTVDSLNLQK